MNTPSVGRAVHYVSHGTPIREDGTQAFTPQCRAATVTVTNPTGIHFQPLAEGGCFLYDPAGSTCSLPPGDRRGGTWHWPEFVR
jgi:hypothetical protein